MDYFERRASEILSSVMVCQELLQLHTNAWARDQGVRDAPRVKLELEPVSPLGDITVEYVPMMQVGVKIQATAPLTPEQMQDLTGKLSELVRMFPWTV
jgi:hypothetical protein